MFENINENPKNILDRFAPDTPVVLEDTTQHSLWCNTKAIELIGIDNLKKILRMALLKRIVMKI